MDVFSFGVVLWELWTGKEPYDGLNYHALMHQMSSEACLRPCLPGSPDWDPAVGPEPVSGYQNLMERCWSVSTSPPLYFPLPWAAHPSGAHSFMQCSLMLYTCRDCGSIGNQTHFSASQSASQTRLCCVCLMSLVT